MPWVLDSCQMVSTYRPRAYGYLLLLGLAKSLAGWWWTDYSTNVRFCPHFGCGDWGPAKPDRNRVSWPWWSSLLRTPDYGKAWWPAARQQETRFLACFKGQCEPWSQPGYAPRWKFRGATCFAVILCAILRPVNRCTHAGAADLEPGWT